MLACKADQCLIWPWGCSENQTLFRDASCTLVTQNLVWPSEDSNPKLTKKHNFRCYCLAKTKCYNILFRMFLSETGSLGLLCSPAPWRGPLLDLQSCCRLEVWKPTKESGNWKLVWRFGDQSYQRESCVRWELEENWRPSSFPLLPCQQP